MTRSSLLEALGQDYIRTARAKGLREMRVVMRHAVRNSLMPVVTIIGLSFGGLVSGAVLTETIFGFAGIGKTLYDGITARDYTLVQGVTLVTAIAFVIINLIVDVLYGFLTHVFGSVNTRTVMAAGQSTATESFTLSQHPAAQQQPAGASSSAAFSRNRSAVLGLIHHCF